MEYQRLHFALLQTENAALFVSIFLSFPILKFQCAQYESSTHNRYVFINHINTLL